MEKVSTDEHFGMAQNLSIFFCAMNSHLKKSTKDKTYLNSRMIRMTHNKNDICLFWQPCCSVAKSCSILWPDELLHTKLLCPSLSPGVCSNSHPLSWWCHSTSHPMSPLLLFPSVFPSIRVFFNESALHIRRPKYWSFRFSISPSNEYSRLISFRIDCFDLFAVQWPLKHLL